VIVEEIWDNDTVVAVENECAQRVVLALVEYLCQESYSIKRT